MNAGYLDQNEGGGGNSPWPIRLLLRTGWVASVAQAERVLIAFVALVLILTAWTFLHKKPISQDSSGEKSPIEERLGNR